MPLSTVKGVGARAEDIIKCQPFADLNDLALRARPNRMMVSALAEANALNCLSEISEFEYLEDFMEHWDNLVAERNKLEKTALRLKKIEENNSLSIDKIVSANKSSEIKSTKSEKITKLLSDDLFD